MNPKRLLLGQVPLAIVSVVGIALSWVSYAAIKQHYRDQANLEFSTNATGYVNLIVDGFARAIFAIESVGAYYSASQSVTDAQFAKFVAPMLQRFPTIKALGWVPRVTPSERSEFEQAAQTDHPGFRITEVGPNNNLVSVGERPAYFPVRLIRPVTGNEAAIGFDIYSNPIRQAAIDSAIRSGRTTSTARIRLVQETGQQFSVLIISPVYGRTNPQTGEEEIRGVASAVYRIGDGVERALAQVGVVPANVWLYDRSDDAGGEFLHFYGAAEYKSGQKEDEPKPPIASVRYVQDFRLGERDFRLVMVPAGSHIERRGGYLAWVALFVGLLLTGLVAAYILLTLRRSHDLLIGQEALKHQVSQRERVEQKLREVNQELQKLSREDPLMGISNRRYFDEYFAQEWKRAVRHKAPLSLLIGDIDYFKEYNDTFGHVAGDKCLQRIAKALRESLERPGDLVARYGGEEIALVLPSTPEDGARDLAEKLRVLVSSLPFADVSSPAQSVTISIGYGTIVPEPNGAMEDFIRAVDGALYRAKQQGRNRTVGTDSSN